MTESTSEYKKRIEEIKQSIENEPYMAKMREDIAEGISKTGIRQATVEEQFQSVLDETTGKDIISAPEIILSRDGAQTLGERLDSDKAEVTAQLAQTESKLNTSTTSKRPLVVFISDDTRKGDLSVIASIFESHGVPCNFACITGDVGVNSNSLTATEINELINRGHGIMSHTHTHRDMTTLTEAELEIEFETTKSKFKEITGFETRALAYPYGNWNEKVVKVARKYFDYAFSTLKDGYLLNDDTLEQYAIVRDVICYDMGANPRTLANIKPLIDRCKNEGKLLVYCIHSAEFEIVANQALINDVISYIKDSDVEIVKHDVALEEKTNVLDIGTFKTPYAKISKSGHITSSNLEKIIESSNSFNSSEEILSTTPLTFFDVGKITKNVIFNGSEGFPPGGGLLFTYYQDTNTDMNFQIFYPQNAKSFYKRNWNRWGSEWLGWNRFNPVGTGFDTVIRNATTPLTDFSVGVTHSIISSANTANFPVPAPGLLITYYLQDVTNMNFQIFYPQDSYYSFRRNWNRFNNSWREWAPVNVNFGGTKPSRPFVGQQFFDTAYSRPIWCKTRPVLDSAGTVITPAAWVDSTGTVV